MGLLSYQSSVATEKANGGPFFLLFWLNLVGGFLIKTGLSVIIVVLNQGVHTNMFELKIEFVLLEERNQSKCRVCLMLITAVDNLFDFQVLSLENNNGRPY